MADILILNGPNLNMLGVREPEIYGTETLDDIRALCSDAASRHGLTIEFLQSNYEGDLVTWIQKVHPSQGGKVRGVVINAAALTHTSVAIHDALKMLSVPVIEVHLSDPKTRESFRHHSYIEPIAAKVIAGHGPAGYAMAIDALAGMME